MTNLSESTNRDHVFTKLRIGLVSALALGLSGCAAVTAAAPESGAEAGTEAQTIAAAPLSADEIFIEDLLTQMTLDEKIAQITTLWTKKADILAEDGTLDLAKMAAAYPNGVGHIARPSDKVGFDGGPSGTMRTTRDTVELVNSIQKYTLENSRLKIPVLFHEEGLHGFQANGATSFPQSIALASSWDPELLERVFSVTAREIRARGSHLVLSPVVDVARDPRWGRIEETYGEDPYLVGELGVAAIRGFQGDTLPLADNKVMATLKHMTGHGQPESGTNVGPANLSERLLREVFFPPFEEVVRRTKIQSVMASYNEIDGVPSHANDWLLNDVLRGEWGFEGGVVSDYWAIDELNTRHSVTDSLKSAGARALVSGVDFDLPDGTAFTYLPEALEEGLVTEADIDRAVRRMLQLKLDANLFETPYVDADYAEAVTEAEDAQALALEAARKSIVLLKNDGILPLAKDTASKIAVVGPLADKLMLGGYSGEPTHTATLLQGLQAQAGENVEIIHHPGVDLVTDGNWWQDEVTLGDPIKNRQMIAEAKTVAAEADVIVLAIGGTEATSREAWGEQHLGDRTDIELVGEQEELAWAMFSLGKPVIILLQNGRPLGIDEIAPQADAIIEAWYVGQAGGTAMAEVLFGDVNPGGKLPVTIPRDAGQIPLVYNHKPTALRGYLFGTTAPLYAFGHGLSYTSFELSEPRLSAPTIAPDGKVIVSVDVTNTGDRAGDEVVQLYIRDELSSVTRPVKELKGFKRVSLAPGESQTVELEIGPRHLRFWDIDMQRTVEPGTFQIMTGPNSVDLKSVTLTVE